jgi:Tol biopolymer transport system component
MNTLNHTLRRLIELALLVALILVMIFAIRTIGMPPGGKPEGFTNPQAGALWTPAPEEPDSGTPYVPPAQDLAMPIPVVTIFAAPPPTSIPWQVEAGNPYPEPGFALTFTPFPSPTMRLGPTETPLPLVGPAPDASGVIRYLAAGEAGTSLLVSQPVDTLGLAKSALQRQLFSAEISLEDVVHPAPDGRYMAVLSYSEGGFSGELLDVISGVMIPFFSNINLGVFYNWFPDGQRILMRSDERGLWLADPITGKYIALVVPDYGSVFGGTASPDGKFVVYSYHRGVDSQLSQVRVVNSDGRDDRLILESGSPPTHFAWSPDSKKIALLYDGWMVMNSDGSELRHLAYLAPPGCNINPIAWSPDSRTLAIVSSEERLSCTDWSNKVLENSNIYLLDIESGKAHPLLTDGIKGNIHPTWSPDGKQIAFVSNRSGAPELWVVNVDGSNLRQLTSAGESVRYPFWSSR